jgi:hypothetical protein
MQLNCIDLILYDVHLCMLENSVIFRLIPLQLRVVSEQYRIRSNIARVAYCVLQAYEIQIILRFCEH